MGAVAVALGGGGDVGDAADDDVGDVDIGDDNNGGDSDEAVGNVDVGFGDGDEDVVNEVGGGVDIAEALNNS